MIYKVLIISTSRIKARYNPHTSTIYLRLEHDGENRVAVAFLIDAVRGLSPSMEISEVFFKLRGLWSLKEPYKLAVYTSGGTI